MFWQYKEWTNAFIIQLIAIIVAYIYGKKNKVENVDLFLVISLASPVAIFLVSAGVSGAIFLSDFAAIYLLLTSYNRIRRTKLIVLAFILFLFWPIISTIISNGYAIVADEGINFDLKILLMQTSRYCLYFILFAKLASKPLYEPNYLIKLFKVQSIILLFIFISILFGYLNIIKVDAWNELIKYELLGTLGKGGMFLYRGGVGTLGAISIPIIYFCFIHGTGFYKYLMALLIFVVFSAVLFSGSRQGIAFTIIAFLFSMILFKQHKKNLQILIFGLIIIFLLLQNDTIRETSSWVFDRYNNLLYKNIDLANEIGSRNFALDEALRQKKDFIYEIYGLGLGGKIYPTESDYYNSYSYFGIIGFIIYIFFILYTTYKIYFYRKATNDILLKQIFGLSLIISLVMPPFGFQQWYIMTYGSNNAVNIFYVLFILALAFSYPNNLYKKNKI